MLGYYFATTTTLSALIAALTRLKVPQVIIIPLAVFFRFLPTVREEAIYVNDAMRMRNIGLSLKKFNLIKVVEYRFVPLLMSMVRIGEELTAASMCRGLSHEYERTNIAYIGIRLIDTVMIFMMGVIMLIQVTKI